MAKAIFIPQYWVNNRRVEFWPIRAMKLGPVPGFTHYVIIDGVRRDYLGDIAKPNARSAIYFETKHPRPIIQQERAA